MLDYLIVGLGLAGISFCEELEKHGKSYRVINDDSQQASVVAGGLYNPVILKRFTLAWKAAEQLQLALPFYTRLEKKLGVKLNYPLPVYRRFASIEEQNLWFEAADKKGLDGFLSNEIHSNTNPNIDAPFGYGEVLGAGRIDTKLLVASYTKHLLEKDCFREERFEYNQLEIVGSGTPSEMTDREIPLYDATKLDGPQSNKPRTDEPRTDRPHRERPQIERSQTNEAYIRYSSPESGEIFKARQIVFAEGFGMKNNPFFDYLPMQGSKGEYLFIKAPELEEVRAIKSSIFVIPEGDALYRAGANYAGRDKTNETTDEARRYLLAKLDAIIRCDYEVVDQVAGVRPTVSDRRPLVGRHPEYQNVYLLNGFGSRGVMVGPYAANQLYRYSSEDVSLDTEIDITRFSGSS